MRHHARVRRHRGRVKRAQAQAVQTRGARQGDVRLAVFKRARNGQFEFVNGHSLRFVDGEGPGEGQGNLTALRHHLAVLLDGKLFAFKGQRVAIAEADQWHFPVFERPKPHHDAARAIY